MFCPECGTELADEALSCYKCGSLTSKGMQAQSAQQQAAPQVAAAPMGQSAQQYQQPVQQAQPAQQYQQPVQQTQSAQQYQQPVQQAQPAQQYQQPVQPTQQAYQQPGQQQWQQPGQQQAYQQPGQQYQQPGQAFQNVTPDLEKLQKYQTMGGWLLFFVICEILGAISYASSAVQSLQAGSPLGAVIYLADIALSVVFLVQLFQRKDTFLRIYQIICFVRMGLAVIMIALGMVVVSGSSSAGVAAAVGAGAFIGIGIAIGCLVLMTMYYCKSVRVRTYMGGTSYIEKALFKIGV